MSENRHDIENIMAKVPQQRITLRAKTFKLPLTIDETVEQSPLSRNDLASKRSAIERAIGAAKNLFVPRRKSRFLAARSLGKDRGASPCW